MTENIKETEISKLDGKGALWTIAGTAIGGLATSWLRGLHGGSFGGYGGYGNGMMNAATSAVLLSPSQAFVQLSRPSARSATFSTP